MLSSSFHRPKYPWSLALYFHLSNSGIFTCELSVVIGQVCVSPALHKDNLLYDDSPCLTEDSLQFDCISFFSDASMRLCRNAECRIHRSFRFHLSAEFGLPFWFFVFSSFVGFFSLPCLVSSMFLSTSQSAIAVDSSSLADLSSLVFSIFPCSGSCSYHFHSIRFHSTLSCRFLFGFCKYLLVCSCAAP